jgi:hypothetical protein
VRHGFVFPLTLKHISFSSLSVEEANNDGLIRSYLRKKMNPTADEANDIHFSSASEGTEGSGQQKTRAKKMRKRDAIQDD